MNFSFSPSGGYGATSP